MPARLEFENLTGAVNEVLLKKKQRTAYIELNASQKPLKQAIMDKKGDSST